jgi:hypothetical protein
VDTPVENGGTADQADKSEGEKTIVEEETAS